ncbi:MAG: spore germination protein [Clostridia bacterium]|nr:spore germination protein [Clostridia bacterium]
MEEKNVNNFNSAKDIVDYIKNSTSHSEDMVYKEFMLGDEIVNIVFNESTTNGDFIADFISRSLKNLFDEKINESTDKEVGKENTNKEEDTSNKKRKGNLQEKLDEKKQFTEKKQENSLSNNLKNLDKNLGASKIKKIDIKTEDIFYYLFSGFTCIIYKTDIFAVESKASLDRSIAEPSTENTIKGPKDSFIENYSKNVGLIRKRLKTEKLVLEEQKVGRRSKTKVGIMYVSDIVRMELVDNVKEKLKKIDIDAILDSNYIMEILEKSKKADFPTIISTERPDLVSYYILQGRIALVVENSPFVLVIPAFIMDFVNNVEDTLQKSNGTILTKIIRYIAFIVTIVTPAFYVALITFDQEAIPTQLLVSFATQREGVPFPALVEAFLMIIAFEILREGDYRVPNAAGSTLSIVGALILGDAAVNAGIVSPIMIIVIAITTISGLMFSDINMSNALRLWRLIFLVFAGLAGIMGVAMAGMLFIIKLASTTSYSKPFSYPISPINFTNIKKTILERIDFSKDTKRRKILTDNLTKYRKLKE